MSETVILPFSCEDINSEKLENLVVNLKFSFDLAKMKQENNLDCLNLEDIVLDKNNIAFIEKNRLNERQIKNKIYKFFNCSEDLENFVYKGLKDDNQELKNLLSCKFA